MKLSAVRSITTFTLATLIGTHAWAASKHEIYSLIPNTALSGVIDPDMPDRTSINKALPLKKKGERLRIGWTEITLGNPWFVSMIDDSKTIAKKYNYDIELQVADSDVAKQSAQVDNFITLGVDLIVIDPTDVLGSVSDIERAVAAGIPVITVGTAPDSEAPVITTSTGNPYGSGFEAGSYVASKSDPASVINAAMVIGVMGNSTSESRMNGMISGLVYARSQERKLGLSKEDAMLKGFKLFQQVKAKGSFSWPEGGFNVLAWGRGDWTEEGGLAATEDILASQGDKLNLVLAENDFIAIGAINALENAGKTNTVMVASGAGSFRVALDLIKQGKLMVSATNSGSETGVAAIELIHQILEKGLDANNLPLASYFPVTLITPDNVDTYIKADSLPPSTDNVPPFRSIGQIKTAMK
ncbi:sugar ABC transporter substrate-binding protein [Pseudomonas sp. SWRI74]|uniref:Sugar ABC transporter substrate-binding protein n=1 Tax=Pseudomonas azerbaijanoccidentalis TaxID=2842347 RepID=A0ABS6QQF2_9PSED|nr:sugar ABC transporter substrate-binding protein [Pseudomonas azerbaijanoccidentalis]MBV4521164.1 sugar ABC transporter substrate-binding protein [Pseudomonas azerbaijanoccidentalis]